MRKSMVLLLLAIISTCLFFGSCSQSTTPATLATTVSTSAPISIPATTTVTVTATPTAQPQTLTQATTSTSASILTTSAATSTTPSAAVTETYDFENQQTPLPNTFEAVKGAQIQMSGSATVQSKYELDSSVFNSRAKSLKISSDINTDYWYAVCKSVPSNYDGIVVNYFVKGNNIRKEGNQYDNCYVGFMFTDNSGKKTFKVNHYNGTFNWQKGTLNLSSSELNTLRQTNSIIYFNIFLSKSGELWIDDISLQYYQPITPTSTNTPASQKISSLDYFMTTAGTGINYRVKDNKDGLNCRVWVVSQFNTTLLNKDYNFVFTLTKDGSEGGNFANSQIAGWVALPYNGVDATCFQLGNPVGNQAWFYYMFALPRFFNVGDSWGSANRQYKVEKDGANIINGITFTDCIKVSITTSDQSSAYLKGSGYFIIAKGTGIIKIVFNRTEGTVVTYEILSTQIFDQAACNDLINMTTPK